MIGLLISCVLSTAPNDSQDGAPGSLVRVNILVASPRPPSPTPGPAIAIHFAPDAPSFNLFGNVTNETLRVTYGGFPVLLRLGRNQLFRREIVRGAPATLCGVTLSLHPVQLANSTLLLVFKVSSSNSTQQIVDIGVEADITFNNNDYAPVWGIPDQRGFIISSIPPRAYDAIPGNYTLNWLLRGFPLVTNVSTYWFGPWGEGTGQALTQNWTQGTSEDLNWFGSSSSIDTSMAFSWQNITLPPRGTTSRAVIAKFGPLSTATLGLTLSFRGLEGPTVFYTAIIEATGTITSNRQTGQGTLVLVIDEDYMHIFSLERTYPVNQPFNYTVTVADWDVPPGPHDFSIYALDTEGNVAPPYSFTKTVIAPTATRSQSPNPTFTPSPRATRTPAPPNVRIETDWSTVNSWLMIWGVNATSRIQTTWGYSVSLLSGQNENVMYDSEARLLDVTLSVIPKIIAPNAALLIFRLRNLGREARVLNVSIVNDVLFDFTDYPPISNLEPQSGYVISSRWHALTFLLRDYPLVKDVSSYWFGAFGDQWVERFSQVTRTEMSDIDAAAAWSWQNVHIGAGRELLASVIVKFGTQNPAFTLALKFDDVPDSVYYATPIVIPANSYHSNSTEAFRLLVVVDDLNTIFFVNQTFAVNTQVNITFQYGDYDVREGTHQFMFYGVDSRGTVSPLNDNSILTTLIAPTATPGPSISLTRSPSPSVTPLTDIAIEINDNTNLSFQIVGRVGDETVTTAGEWGYLAGLRIGRERQDMLLRMPAVLRDVWLTVSHRILSRTTALVTLRTENRGTETQTVDFGVAADIKIGDELGTPVFSLGDRRGFEVVGRSCKITFITSGYPLVDDVSTYWFGYYYDYEEERFNQVEVDSFNGDSALAYTWQAVPVMPGEVVTRSVIVKFGTYQTPPLTIAISLPTIGEELRPDGKIALTGTTQGNTAVLGNAVELFAVPDGRSGDVLKLPGGPFALGRPFSTEIQLGPLALSSGKHSLQVCAVGQEGDVSQLSAAFDVTIVAAAQTAAAETGSIGGVIGGSVGGVVAVALAVVLAVFLIQRSHKRSDDEQLGSDYGDTKAQV
jgi:hypothetical protein